MKNSAFLKISALLAFSQLALFAFDPLFVENRQTNDNCQKPNLANSLTLEDAINYAMCNNPSVIASLANTLSSQAQMGVARSSYLPTISANASKTKSLNNTNNLKTDQISNNLSLSASYLLYDFGAREARNAYAREQFLILNGSKDATIQSVFLQTAQAYYNTLASRASLQASLESENFSKQSYEAALKRYEVGIVTPSDKLQAKTAYASAKLSRIKAEGDEKISLALLANLIGIDANTKISLVTPNEEVKIDTFSSDVGELIKKAKADRPEMRSAKASVGSARESLYLARAQYTPSISLSASSGYNDYQSDSWTRSSQIGAAISIPIFSGFSTLYEVKSAKEKLKSAEALLEQEDKQISYEVFSAYQTLLTQTESLGASIDLLASAEESYRMALGKYKAGVGGILDLLNAQSALAEAKKQKISAFYSWQIAKVSLAKSIGEIDANKIIKR